MKKQKPHGQPCLMSSEITDEGCQIKTYFSNLSRGLLGLEVPFGKEGTGKGFVTSPADSWKRTQIKPVRDMPKPIPKPSFPKFQVKMFICPKQSLFSRLSSTATPACFSPDGLSCLTPFKLFPSSEKFSSSLPCTMTKRAVRLQAAQFSCPLAKAEW